MQICISFHHFTLDDFGSKKVQKKQFGFKFSIFFAPFWVKFICFALCMHYLFRIHYASLVMEWRFLQINSVFCSDTIDVTNHHSTNKIKKKTLEFYLYIYPTFFKSWIEKCLDILVALIKREGQLLPKMNRYVYIMCVLLTEDNGNESFLINMYVSM